MQVLGKKVYLSMGLEGHRDLKTSPLLFTEVYYPVLKNDLEFDMLEKMLADVPAAPVDAVFGLVSAFNNDPFAGKVNLTIGVYQDDDGITQTFQAVKEAEQGLAKGNRSKVYLPIAGNPAFRHAALSHIFHDSAFVDSGRIQGLQTPGGTGALSLAAQFISTLLPTKTLWMPNPTWANHKNIFRQPTFGFKDYPYYNRATNSLDMENLVKTLRDEAQPGDAILLHACCHNPTGLDPIADEWKTIADVCQEKELLPVFDCAYQGFADNFEQDIEAVKIFNEKGLTFLLAHSFSKNFGLYNERVGLLSIVSPNADRTHTLFSQLQAIARRTYSNPPAHGAAVIQTVLEDASLTKSWKGELDSMRTRLTDTREKFVRALKNAGIDWSFLLKQRGMFSFTDLSPEQVDRLKDEFHVYLMKSGRVNVAGLNDKNMGYVVESIAAVV